MWHGRHHSAQKSTSTGWVAEAVSTSASKFPSVTVAMLSAIFFVLNELYDASLPLSPHSSQLDDSASNSFHPRRGVVPVAHSSLRECLPGMPLAPRHFIEFSVFPRWRIPGKIFGHAVQLN